MHIGVPMTTGVKGGKALSIYEAGGGRGGENLKSQQHQTMCASLAHLWWPWTPPYFCIIWQLKITESKRKKKYMGLHSDTQCSVKTKALHNQKYTSFNEWDWEIFNKVYLQCKTPPLLWQWYIFRVKSLRQTGLTLTAFTKSLTQKKTPSERPLFSLLTE